MLWYQTDARRLAKEIDFMEHGSRARLVRSDGELSWVEHLLSPGSGQEYTLVIDYPARFPYEPPKAFIASPSIEGAPHRLADGSLCLFGDAWRAVGLKTTALLVRNRAVTWFLAFEIWRATGEWMAPEHEGIQ